MLKNNPFYIQELIVPNVISNILHDAIKRHLMSFQCRWRPNVQIYSTNFNGLCKTRYLQFLQLRYLKMNTANRLLNILHQYYLYSNKRHKVGFNRTVLGTSQRPDFS